MKTLLFFSFLATSVAWAEMDSSSQQALEQTQKLLESASQRQQVINQSPDLQKLDGRVEDLAGDEQNKEKLYELSSQVMKNLAEKNAGDPEAMKQALDGAQKDPEKFMKEYFNSNQQNAVRNLANEIQKNGANPPAPPKPTN